MAQLATMTKAQLLAVLVTDLGYATDDDVRKDAALAKRFRRRRRLEREAAAAASAEAKARFEAHQAALNALENEPPIGDDE